MKDPAGGANVAVAGLLDDRLRDIEAAFGAHAIALYGPIDFSLDDTLRDLLEIRKSSAPDQTRLVVLLDTDGGYLDVVTRMVDTIRHHYQIVDFVIPNVAYSAGTILAMSGDNILMDYYSRLGPIDPQVPDDKGGMIPALGYLKRYEDLIAKAAGPGGLSIAEIQLLINGFDQAQLYMYGQARELSVKLLGDWLCKYKFKDWHETETRHAVVTEDMRRQRAEEVANQLNDTDRWHSHSYGISGEVLRAELKLRIDDFGEHAEVIRKYNDLLKDYMGLNGVIGAVHVPGTYRPYHQH